MKIAVLTSGGVDSAVSLKLLQEKGESDITAFYLKIWLEDELSYLGDCPWEEDLAYVQDICQQSKIPLEVISLQKEYWNEIVSYSLNEIKAGRTPNSDLLCNSKIKFGKFYDKIDSSFNLIATGHYAQTEEKKGIFYLKKSLDSFKDQTYFLAQLNQKQLQKALFPIGHLKKQQVRELANQFNLSNANRKDSQGICFLGQIKYSEFVRYHFGTKTGNLIDFDSGKKVGEHKGYWFYTIGQRKGIELSGGPWFVVRKDIDTNTVFISHIYHDLNKKRDHFQVHNLNWISASPTQEQLADLQIKVRHGENYYNAKLSFPTQTKDFNKIIDVQIDQTDQGLAAGQFAVFYSGDFCLGCGVIK